MPLILVVNSAPSELTLLMRDPVKTVFWALFPTGPELLFVLSVVVEKNTILLQENV